MSNNGYASSERSLLLWKLLRISSVSYVPGADTPIAGIEPTAVSASYPNTRFSARCWRRFVGGKKSERKYEYLPNLRRSGQKCGRGEYWTRASNGDGVRKSVSYGLFIFENYKETAVIVRRTARN